MGDKMKEQLLEELAEVQKMLEEKTEIQGHMIRKFQLLIENEGLFSQIIDFFPYPIAIFTPQHTLTMVNKAFAAETKMRLW
jgi:PAS domain-containing protein